MFYCIIQKDLNGSPPHDPTIQFLGISPGEISAYIPQSTYLRMHRTTLSRVAPNYKHSKGHQQ